MTADHGTESRRRWLAEASIGFGGVAFAALAARRARAEPARRAARARSVIFCYMSGGVSHVDSFDPKPRLDIDHGKPLPMKVERTMFNNNGLVMRSPFTFRPWGASGIPVSSMFPHVGAVVDELAVIRSMTSPVSEHAQANFLMHTGFPFLGFPSAGAWASYGLGSVNDDLPTYVVLQSGDAAVPHGGVGLFSNAFLPGPHQASIVKADGADPIRNIRPRDGAAAQRRRLDAVAGLDRGFLAATADPPAVAAAIANAETAFRMQAAVPKLVDLSGESAATLARYGVDSPNAPTAAYARQCLLARRLVEEGVRFVELSCLTQNIGAGGAGNPWDQHGDLAKGHAAMARQVDQPIGALLGDLRDRGLLDETLVVWAGEFGRTPFSQGADGRDHNPMAFSVWLAGGGVKRGTIHGVTDDYGYRVVDQPCTVYDMWATVLHLLGIDHEELTFRWGGRDYRLTDVHGNVIRPILA